MRAHTFVRTLILLSLVGTVPALAQEKEPTGVEVGETEPLAADVETIDGIVTAFYDVISGPVGEPRQWSRDATLYPPNIQFTPTGVDAEGDPTGALISKQVFIDNSDAFLVDAGFTEREIHRVTRRFGNVADVASTYEWATEDGRSGRGINFIHLFNDGSRWWITHATWDSERDDNPIPAEYLPQ